MPQCMLGFCVEVCQNLHLKSCEEDLTLKCLFQLSLVCKLLNFPKNSSIFG